MAVAWCALFLQPDSVLQILTGIVTVSAGLFLGYRVKQRFLLHGLILGISGFLMGLGFVWVYSLLLAAGVVPSPVSEEGLFRGSNLVGIYIGLSIIHMLPFTVLGTVMAGRAAQRNRESRDYIDQRGGRLEKPTTVRTVDDVRGQSLPQLGTYVMNLFRKKGFTFIDYRFLDKDKHLDLEMEYQGETYLLRLSVADKVRPGTTESLLQDMRRREITKGIVITSTEFTADAQKAARSRRNLVLIDGQTLFDIAEY
ncbi:MAG: restriction endonuclease [Chloroflexaceae bacterium]|nr:restriction endonuclease [Chloroflexaceae bacterium]